MQGCQLRMFLLSSPILLFSVWPAAAQPSTKQAGNQTPSSSGLPGVSYDHPNWPGSLPNLSAAKRYVACYQMNYGSSSAQPFILTPVHPVNIETAGKTAFDVRCDAVSTTDQDPDMRKWCAGHPKGSWTPCSPMDEDHPILMGQTLVMGVDLTKVQQDRMKILNLNVTTASSSSINATPIRPSFSTSGFVALSGPVTYLTWPAQIPGDVLPTISVNLVYTPPTPGEAWSRKTYYPYGSIVTSSTRNGHYYMAVGSGVSGAEQPPFPVSLPVTVNDGAVIWQDTGPAAPAGSGPGSGKAPGVWLPSHSYQPGDAIIDPYNGHVYVAMVQGQSGPRPSEGNPPPVMPSFPTGDAGIVKESQDETNKLAWTDLGVTPPASVAGTQASDQTVNLLNLQLPQSHSRSYYNLAAGVVYSTVHNRTFGIPSGVTSSSGEVETSSSATIDPVLLFTGYPWPSDTERHCSFPKCMWQTKPGVSFGLSLASPSSSFYAGTSVELVRNIQLVLGWNWSKQARLPNPPVALTGNSPSPATVQKFENGPFFGLTFNVSGFIQGLFGGGGSPSKSTTTPSSTSPGS
jgi:hypothetical protein